MEMITLSIVNENEAIQELRHQLDAQIFCKQKKDFCLLFDALPSPNFFKKVLDAFFDYKSAYLKMIKYEVPPAQCMDKFAIHAGETLTIDKQRIIVGDIHEGGHVIVNSNVVIIGEIRGIVTLVKDDCSVFGTKFLNAAIMTNFGEKHLVNGKNLLINFDVLGGNKWHE